MRVAELTGLREFRLVEGSLPEPGPGEVQVRVDAVGICGSDMHSYSEGGIGDTRCKYPMVLGHEPAGTIVKTGAGVSGWATGDLVGCEPALFCYHCEFCQSGRHNLCSTVRFMSTPTEAGFFRERVNLPVSNLLALPPGIDASRAALVEPLSIALHSLRLCPPGIGETAVVIGAGPIGLFTAAALKLAGTGRVWVVEPLAHRRELVQSLGADVALAPTDALATVLADTHGRGVDMVFDCAAKADTANESLRLVRPGGRIVYTGIPSELRTPIDTHIWRRKEAVIYQVRRSNREGHAAVEILARHLRTLAPVVTHTRSLTEIRRAFGIVENYEDGVGKLVIRPQEA
jgi:L-iditol 2-dehydrogenase